MTMTRDLPSGAREYDVAGFDEAFAAAGEVRPAYRDVMTALAGRDLHAMAVVANERLARAGVVFGDDEHAFRVDPVPRVLTVEEWDRLSAGLSQRVRALDEWCADLYGARRAVAEGVVPEEVLAGLDLVEEDLVGVRPAGGAWISLAGLDVVRDGQGRFHVLEDNARTPSGLAYAMAASDAVSDVLGIDRPREEARAEVRTLLRRAMEASAPDVDGELVLLTDGEENTASFEHETVAGMCGLELATPSSLRVVGGRVELADGRRVRAVYRRTEEDRLRSPSGSLTALGELLLEPLRSGAVGIVNWFGTGVADDKNVYAYVDDLVRFYLGEEPIVGSVPTYDVRDRARLEEVLDRIDELVVKPRDGLGGRGVVVGPVASAAELDAARRALREDPASWIAQDVVALSTHPTVVDGALSPRHVDLRPFVFNERSTVSVPGGGLTRVALEVGSMIVNSSRQGGGKATWVV
jgi:carboxylate-amine ligase